MNILTTQCDPEIHSVEPSRFGRPMHLQSFMTRKNSPVVHQRQCNSWHLMHSAFFLEDFAWSFEPDCRLGWLWIQNKICGWLQNCNPVFANNLTCCFSRQKAEALLDLPEEAYCILLLLAGWRAWAQRAAGGMSMDNHEPITWSFGRRLCKKVSS